MRSSEAAVPGLFSTRVSDFVDPDDETGEIGAILLSQVDRLKVAYTRCQLFRNSAPKVAKWHFSKPGGDRQPVLVRRRCEREGALAIIARAWKILRQK
jgi:hypothetical protein